MEIHQNEGTKGESREIASDVNNKLEDTMLKDINRMTSPPWILLCVQEMSLI